MIRVNKNHINKNHGFAITSILLAISIMSTSMLSFLSRLNISHKETNELAKKFRSRSIEMVVNQLMDNDRCSCHFDPTKNTETSTSSLSINTVQPQDISLGSIRSGCDFTSSNNIFLKNGTSVGEGLVVDKIKVSSIKAATNSQNVFNGNIVISYSSQNTTSIPSASLIPMTFTIDTNEGSNQSRPIKACMSSKYHLLLSSSSGSCYLFDTSMTDKSGGRTLIGCGGSVSTDRARFTTAFGFRAGSSTVSHIGNTYFGYESGLKHDGEKTTMVGYKTGRLATSLKQSTLIGYRAGEQTQSGQNFYAIGAEAGTNTQFGNENIFIGTLAGNNNRQGSRNIYLGHEAGRYGIRGNDNIFAGYQAGLQNRGSRNIFIGSRAGQKNLTGEDSVLIGCQAGLSNTFIHKSVFMGYQAGKSSQGGQSSTLIGYQTGFNNKAAKNTFIGNYSGYNNKKGHHNVFVGHASGQKNTTGSYNTFLGTYAGYQNKIGSYNTFAGNRSGYNNTRGQGNTFMGYKAGASNTTGSYNVFIGHQAANNSNYSTASYKLVIGSPSAKTWMTGDITATGGLYINGQEVGSPPSSKFLKKNIRPVTNFKKYLNSVLKTPLFTYQYKSSMNFPHKTRMGIISEELPKQLQIVPKGKLSHPDWPSIYGYFWASFKALHEIRQELKNTLLLRIQDSLLQLKFIKEKQARFIEKWIHNRQKMSLIQSEIRRVYEEMEQVKKETAQVKKNFDRDWENLMIRLSPSPLSPSQPSPSSTTSSSIVDARN